MDRRTRICIWIIVLGLLNFLAYTIMYMSLGGDAMNGHVAREARNPHLHYYLGAKGEQVEVGRTTWFYSAIHSISIWLTVGAVLLAMLTLAKDRIVSSMRSAILHGRTFITILATVVTMISLITTTWFVLLMIHDLRSPGVYAPVPALAAPPASSSPASRPES